MTNIVFFLSRISVITLQQQKPPKLATARKSIGRQFLPSVSPVPMIKTRAMVRHNEANFPK